MCNFLTVEISTSVVKTFFTDYNVTYNLLECDRLFRGIYCKSLYIFGLEMT
jgi:hypothetical protein